MGVDATRHKTKKENQSCFPNHKPDNNDNDEDHHINDDSHWRIRNSGGTPALCRHRDFLKPNNWMHRFVAKKMADDLFTHNKADLKSELSWLRKNTTTEH
ncbi:unnamed protein product [Ectocarpus sp. 13 AM-2016]